MQNAVTLVVLHTHTHTHTLCLQDYSVKTIANFACKKINKIKRHEFNAQKTVF